MGESELRTVSVRLRAESVALLDRLALDESHRSGSPVSRSDVIRRLLERGLEREILMADLDAQAAELEAAGHEADVVISVAPDGRAHVALAPRELPPGDGVA